MTPESNIIFTEDEYGDTLTAIKTVRGEIMIRCGISVVRLAPSEAEQLAHCLLAWAKKTQ